MVFTLLLDVEHWIRLFILNMYGALILLSRLVRLIMVWLLKQGVHLMLTIDRHTVLLGLLNW